MFRYTSITLTAFLLLTAQAVHAQSTSAIPLIEGTVVSATRSTLVIQTGAEDYKLFVLDAGTTRPPQIVAGSSVSVASRESLDAGAPVATSISVTATPTAAAPGGQAQAPVVPPSVRTLEQSVQRQTKRFRLGVSTGATLDQELFSLGAHTQIGPFFGQNVWARPNIELGFGEVTTLVALNFEAIYRLPVTQREGTWTVFFGGGPSFNFIDQGFEDATGDDVEATRFDEFSFDTGFNLLMGVQSRSGLFLEMKSGAYSAPHIRFLVGYSF